MHNLDQRDSGKSILPVLPSVTETKLHTFLLQQSRSKITASRTLTQSLWNLPECSVTDRAAACARRLSHHTTCLAAFILVREFCFLRQVLSIQPKLPSDLGLRPLALRCLSFRTDCGYVQCGDTDEPELPITIFYFPLCSRHLLT